MTLEAALRMRSRHAGRTAFLCLALALVLLVVAFIFLPYLPARTVAVLPDNINSEATQSDVKTFGLIVAVLAISALSIFYACYLLGLAAARCLELSTRYAAIADSL